MSKEQEQQQVEVKTTITEQQPATEQVEGIKYVNPIARAARYLAKIRAASYASDIAYAATITYIFADLYIRYSDYIPPKPHQQLTTPTTSLTIESIRNANPDTTITTVVNNNIVNETNINNQLSVVDKYDKAKYMGYWSLWHLQASLFFPSFTIHTIVNQTRKALVKFPNLPPRIKVWTPMVIALSSIPFLIHPLDTLADKVMEYTYCKLLDYKAPQHEQLIVTQEVIEKKEH
ncbi:hypothetical protein ABK040_009247 [Willaertia magna]